LAEIASVDAALITVVVPVYNEASGIDALYERLSATLTGLDDLEHEIVFVDDGSSDSSYEQLVALAQKDPHVRVIKFSRNFGHQIAITAGVDLARGDCVVVIDADLQDPPEVIADMVEEWRDGYDVVYGERGKRDGEGFMKLLTASIFYRALGRVAGIKVSGG